MDLNNDTIRTAVGSILSLGPGLSHESRVKAIYDIIAEVVELERHITSPDDVLRLKELWDIHSGYVLGHVETNPARMVLEFATFEKAREAYHVMGEMSEILSNRHPANLEVTLRSGEVQKYYVGKQQSAGDVLAPLDWAKVRWLTGPGVPY